MHEDPYKPPETAVDSLHAGDHSATSHRHALWKAYLLAPADARITMILEGALLKISHEAPELTIGAGEAFQVPVTVSRSAKLQTPVKIKIVPPEQIQDLLSMEPAEVTLPVGVEKMSLKIDTQNAERLQGRWPIVIRASTLQDNHWRVMSQTEVVVDFTR